jgi:fluoroacetyl-CoA thioesterase
VETGLVGEVVHVVSRQDTAVALGSGDVPVLGTPRVAALVEEATVAAVRDALAEGETTVGLVVELEHLRPTGVGATVAARATLTAVDGRRLEFAVQVTGDGRDVARGRVVRSVVDREVFLSRVPPVGG